MGRKIGVFGGTFDPIHTGHLILAEQAREATGLHEIIFMPARQSPYKIFKRTASGEDRYKMIELAIEGNSYFSVSDLELKGSEVSYTVDTLDRLKELHYPEDDLYFICGTDAFMSMSGWKNRERLLAEYNIVVGTRPGYMEKEIDDAIIQLTENYAANITKVAMPKLEISSTDIKQRLENSKSVRYLVPQKVLLYILDKQLYMSDHVTGVMQTGLEMAKIYGADPQKVKTAAEHHDLHRIRQKDNKDADKKNALLHGPQAAETMEKDFGIRDDDVLNAVRYHTTGRAGMSVLEKIIFVADAIEPGRNYPGVDEIRKIAFEDLDKACLMVVESMLQYLKEQGIEPHENTLKAREEFLAKEGRVYE